MATRYTTKPLPINVRISNIIKIMINTRSFVGREVDEEIEVEFDEMFWSAIFQWSLRDVPLPNVTKLGVFAALNTCEYKASVSLPVQD
jgi:hypothetical protein